MFAEASEVTKLELAEQANGYDDDTVVVQADGTAVRVSKKSVHSVGLGKRSLICIAVSTCRIDSTRQPFGLNDCAAIIPTRQVPGGSPC